MNSNFVKVTAISLLNFIGLGLIVPRIVPRILEIGASNALVGASSAIQDGLLVLTGPVVGSWSDLHGRKFVIVVTAAITSACFFIFSFTESLTIIVLLRILLGIVGHTPTLTKALISDVISQENHSKAYVSHGVMASIGFIIGPIMSGHWVETESGFFYICVLASVFYLLILAITQTFPDRKKTDVRSTEPISFRKEFVKTFTELANVDWKTFGDALFLRFLLSFSVIAYFTNRTMVAHKEKNISQAVVGYIIAVFGVAGIVATICVPYLQRKLYKNDSSTFLLHQYVTMSTVFLVSYVTTNRNVIVLLLLPFAFANSAVTIVTLEVILNKAKDNVQGSLNGVSESVMSIGRCFAPLVSGIVATYFGEEKILLLAFLSALLGVFICLKISYNKREHSKKE